MTKRKNQSSLQGDDSDDYGYDSLLNKIEELKQKLANTEKRNEEIQKDLDNKDHDLQSLTEENDLLVSELKQQD